MENFKTVLIQKDSNECYHANKEYIGSTSLKKMIQTDSCPAVWYYDHLNPKEPTDALIIGTAYHTLILEPELFETDYFIMDFDKRPVPDKDFRTKENRDWRERLMFENSNKKILNSDYLVNLINMQNALLLNKRAKYLLSGEQKEISYYVELNGCKIKVRPDNLKEKSIVDLKTCEDASPVGFMRHAYDMGYHISAALYSDVMTLIYGFERPFIFVAQEKKPPYLISIFKATEGFIAQGRLEYELAIEIYKNCLKTGKFSGYEINNENFHGIFDLDLPGYAFRNIKTNI